MSRRGDGAIQQAQVQPARASFGAEAFTHVQLRLDANQTLVVRPIEAGDRSTLAAAFARLSTESRIRRFHAAKPELSARELTYLTDIDHVSHEALAAVDTRGHILAVARYAAWPLGCLDAAEVAIAVIDPFQRRGIGSTLARQIVDRAQANGFSRLTASTLSDNAPARRLLAQLGFRPVGHGRGVASYRLELPAVGCPL